MAQDLACFAKSLWAQEHMKGAHGPEAVQDVSTIEVYVKNWKCTYVVARLGVSPEALGLAKLRNRKIVHHILRCLLNASALLKLPQSCKDRAVMQKACDLRLAEQPLRVKMLQEPVALIAANGDINWKAGAYMAFPLTRP